MNTLQVRVWDEQLCKMLYPDLYWFEHKGIRTVPLDSTGWQIMLATGLSDRRGTPIYESDIVEDTLHHRSGPLAYTRRWVVYWRPTYAGFFLLRIEDAHQPEHEQWMDMLRRENVREVEVIGNVFEHSHLLPQA